MAQDDYIRTALRVPPELHQALHEAADRTSKSFNAEINERLQRTFDDERLAAALEAVQRITVLASWASKPCLRFI